MDFMRNRMFRQTLLCHEDLKPNHALKAEAVTGFFIASGAKATSQQPDIASDKPEEFKGEGALTLTTRDPLMKAAMTHLIAQWPVSVPFVALVEAARQRLGADAPTPTQAEVKQLATRLLNCYTSNLVEFSMSPPQCVREVSERPLASAYARLRARAGMKTTNLRLESIPLTPSSQLVLQNLDGQHDRSALVALLTDLMKRTPAAAAAPDGKELKAEEPAEIRAAKYVDELLNVFAKYALLVG
jgi:methyltransferase-like protein